LNYSGIFDDNLIPKFVFYIWNLSSYWLNFCRFRFFLFQSSRISLTPLYYQLFSKRCGDLCYSIQ